MHFTFCYTFGEDSLMVKLQREWNADGLSLALRIHNGTEVKKVMMMVIMMMVSDSPGPFAEHGHV